MGQVEPAQISDGTTIDAADVNNPINTIADEFNGNIDNSNIASNAAIAGSKLASGGVGTTQLADDGVTPAKLATHIKVGNISISATGADQAFTGIGFQPQAVMFFFLYQDSSAAMRSGVGASDGTDTFAQAIGTAGSTDATIHSVTTTIEGVTGGNTNVIRAVLTSLDADGFTLNVTVLTAGPHSIGYIAFG